MKIELKPNCKEENPRFVIVNDNEEIISDAQGNGYKSRESANRDLLNKFKTGKETPKQKKSREKQTFFRENKELNNFLEETIEENTIDIIQMRMSKKDIINIVKKEFKIEIPEEYIDIDNLEYVFESEKYIALEKNDNLIFDLQQKRNNFATIGTNKAKRRLNKLSLTNEIAKAVRKALEIEDTNIQAKKYYGDYKEKIYNKKNELILEMKEIFDKNKWEYGIQNSTVLFINSIIYFEIPGCEQISWHFSVNKKKDFPKYEKEWDGKENSTLDKLSKITIELLKNANLLEK